MVPQPLPAVWIWLGVPMLYFAGAKLGVVLAVSPEGIAILWPPNSVLLAAMLLARPRDVPVIAALGIVAERLAGWQAFTVVESLIFGVANASEATLAFVLLRAARFDARMQAISDFWRFLVTGPLVAPAGTIAVI